MPFNLFSSDKNIVEMKEGKYVIVNTSELGEQIVTSVTTSPYNRMTDDQIDKIGSLDFKQKLDLSVYVGIKLKELLISPNIWSGICNQIKNIPKKKNGGKSRRSKSRRSKSRRSKSRSRRTV